MCANPITSPRSPRCGPSEDIEDWKRLAALAADPRARVLLTDDLVAEDFAFYGRTLTGTEQIRDRWKRGVSLVESLMGDAVGRLYVERHFPPDAKARMDVLVDNLRKAYRRQHQRAGLDDAARPGSGRWPSWTSSPPKIGYPAKWRDYSTLVIDRADLYGNFQRGYAVNHDRELAKLGGPVDRDEWFMTPQTVNAYYNPGMNEIVFPAAILQPPFFDAEADDAANYGGIGAVIGHEIGHGFDDQGAKYDGDGNLVDWWTDDDRAEFGSRTKALIEQYDAYTPRGDWAHGHHVNGAFTVGENIGDLGGLSIALLAYQLSLERRTRPVIDGLTGVQRVFFGWAQVWRTKSRDAEAIRRLAIDPHSPPEFRCNGVVRNIDAFYDAFERRRRRRAVPGAAAPGQDLELTGTGTGSIRAGTCLCHGVPAYGSRHRGRGERVGRDTRNHGMAVAVDVVEAESVGQRRVPGEHGLADLDAGLGAAGRGA